MFSVSILVNCMICKICLVLKLCYIDRISQYFFRLHNVVGLYEKLQCNILMLEYRGFGLSQGSPSEEGLYMDARAAIEYLATRNDINSNEIIVFGRSLGNIKNCTFDCY